MLAIEACRRKCLNCSQLFIFLNICSRMLLFKKFVKPSENRPQKRHISFKLQFHFNIALGIGQWSDFPFNNFKSKKMYILEPKTIFL